MASLRPSNILEDDHSDSESSDSSTYSVEVELLADDNGEHETNVFIIDSDGSGSISPPPGSPVHVQRVPNHQCLDIVRVEPLGEDNGEHETNVVIIESDGSDSITPPGSPFSVQRVPYHQRLDNVEVDPLADDNGEYESNVVIIESDGSDSISPPGSPVPVQRVPDHQCLDIVEVDPLADVNGKHETNVVSIESDGSGLILVSPPGSFTPVQRVPHHQILDNVGVYPLADDNGEDETNVVIIESDGSGSISPPGSPVQLVSDHQILNNIEIELADDKDIGEQEPNVVSVESDGSWSPPGSPIHIQRVPDHKLLDNVEVDPQAADNGEHEINVIESDGSSPPGSHVPVQRMPVTDHKQLDNKHLHVKYSVEVDPLADDNGERETNVIIESDGSISPPGRSHVPVQRAPDHEHFVKVDRLTPSGVQMLLADDNGEDEFDVVAFESLPVGSTRFQRMPVYQYGDHIQIRCPNSYCKATVSAVNFLVHLQSHGIPFVQAAQGESLVVKIYQERLKQGITTLPKYRFYEWIGAVIEFKGTNFMVMVRDEGNNVMFWLQPVKPLKSEARKNPKKRMPKLMCSLMLGNPDTGIFKSGQCDRAEFDIAPAGSTFASVEFTDEYFKMYTTSLNKYLETEPRGEGRRYWSFEIKIYEP